MINVVVKYAGTQISNIHVYGHALSNVAGKDLVCAGVSAVVIGALNSLQDEQNYSISVKDGDIRVKVMNQTSVYDQTVLSVLLTSLKTIQETYSKYIKITEER